MNGCKASQLSEVDRGQYCVRDGFIHPDVEMYFCEWVFFLTPLILTACDGFYNAHIDQFTGTSQSFYVTDPIYTWSEFADNIVKYRSSDNTGNPEQSHAAARLITAHNQCVHVNTTSSASLGDLVHIATR